MIRIFTLILLSAAIISCKKDRKIEPEIPVEVKLTGLLKSVTIRSASGETQQEYSYTDSLTLKSIRYTRGGQSTVETFVYEKDTLRTSQTGDTLKKYVYKYGRLAWIEKRHKEKPEWYTLVIFTYNSGGKVTRIEKRLNSADELSSKYLGEFSITWRGDNISAFRERFSDGLVEDYDLRYDESKNPFTGLQNTVLRIPAETPWALSYNTASAYTTMFAGMKYQVEGKYMENRLPLSQKISEFNIEKGTDWTTFRQYTFEYYE